MTKKKWVLYCFALFLVHSLHARVSEFQIKILPAGQIAIPVHIEGVENPKYMLLDVTGENLLLGDIHKKLEVLNIDSTASKIAFDNFSIGSYSYKEAISFKISEDLIERSDLSFPDNVVGTIGSSLFAFKAVQINLAAKKMVIADTFEELDFTENLKIIVFSSSFINKIPVVKVNIKNFGTQRLYVNPSKPVSFHFAWNEVSDEAKEMSEGKLQLRTNSLNGTDSLQLISTKPLEVMLESDAKVSGHKPSFSNTNYPCIGNEFLKNYVFTIDYKNAAMYLDPINSAGKTELIEIE